MSQENYGNASSIRDFSEKLMASDIGVAQGLKKDLRQHQRAPMVSGCGRQSARSVIEGRVRRLRNEAEKLDTLLKALPLELPPEADEALWDLACRSGR